MPARHLDALSQKLEDVAAGRCRRLIVSMPPRHGKSELVSVHYPAWYLGNHPDRQVILASYGASLALGFSRKARDILAQTGPELWGVSADPDVSSMGGWGVVRLRPGLSPVAARGFLTAAGVGGPLTGKGADLAIIDDPVKNAEEAASPTVREAVWDWYRSTLRTRLEPGGAIVLVMTRWHEDDLAGRLLRYGDSSGGLAFEELRLPALADDGDALGRESGEALWPERFSREALEAVRIDVGGYVWSALYQQRPQPASGSVFLREWFRDFWREKDGTSDFYVVDAPAGRQRVPISRCWVFQTVDPAATEKTQSDYFAVATWAVTPHRDLLLLDVYREQAETTKHQTILESQRKRWRPAFQAVENRTFGLTIIQEMLAAGLPVTKLDADADKVARARPMSAKYEAGRVYHLLDAAWRGDFEDELIAFPRGAHDDQVDVAAYAAAVLAEMPTPLAQVAGKPEDRPQSIASTVRRRW